MAVANKLVNQEEEGHYGSSCPTPASVISSEAGVVQITPSSTNPDLTLKERRATVFRACGQDDQQGAMAVQIFSGRLEKTRVAILDDKTTYGQGLSRKFEKSLGTGEKMLAYERITQGDKDFSAVLAKLKPLGPEVIFFGGYYPEAGLIVAQMRRPGMRAIFVSGDATSDQEFLNIAGKNAEDSYLSYGPPVEQLSSAKNFVEAYRAKRDELGPNSLYAYDAANVVLKKSTDGGKIA